MKIEVQVFAGVRDAAGSDSITVDVGNHPRAGEIIAAVAEQLPEIASLLSSCRLAVDCSYVTAEATVGGDSEVALIPPVSGG